MTGVVKFPPSSCPIKLPNVFRSKAFKRSKSVEEMHRVKCLTTLSWPYCKVEVRPFQVRIYRWGLLGKSGLGMCVQRAFNFFSSYYSK